MNLQIKDWNVEGGGFPQNMSVSFDMCGTSLVELSTLN